MNWLTINVHAHYATMQHEPGCSLTSCPRCIGLAFVVTWLSHAVGTCMAYIWRKHRRKNSMAVLVAAQINLGSHTMRANMPNYYMLLSHAWPTAKAWGVTECSPCKNMFLTYKLDGCKLYISRKSLNEVARFRQDWINVGTAKCSPPLVSNDASNIWFMLLQHM